MQHMWNVKTKVITGTVS